MQTVTHADAAHQVESDLPILGEPLLPELANTLHLAGGERFDVFDRAATAAAWFAEAPAARALQVPRRLSADDLRRLRHLRDAVRAVLETGSGRSAATSIARINGAARRAPAARQLAQRPDGSLVVRRPPTGRGLDPVLAAIAEEVLTAVEGGELRQVRRCGRPACGMFFAGHHRRRYCNPRCASADRQARYRRAVARR